MKFFSTILISVSLMLIVFFLLLQARKLLEEDAVNWGVYRDEDRPARGVRWY